MEEERLAAVLQAIEAVLGLALSLWCLWTMIPEHRRQLARMRLIMGAQTMTADFARRTGAASMRAELATGQSSYWAPYALSLTRDWLGEAYERARGITP